MQPVKVTIGARMTSRSATESTHVGRPTPVEVRLEAQSPAFGECLALVATTFYLAFANRAIQLSEDAAAAQE